ncbi:MAG: glycosyltransferase family 87 protein [Terracidiphilus sp.]
MSTPVKRSPWRVVAAALIIAFGAVLVGAIEYATITDQKTTKRDYIQYWVIGQRLSHGENPYDIAAIVQLEEKAGLGSEQPHISLSPPVVIFPMLWLALVGPKTGYILWWLLIMGCLSVALWLLWRLNGRPDSRIHLFGYAFAPVIVCLIAGQLSIFLLLGIVLFFSLHRTRPTLAGASLLPCMLKPQLFLVFAFVLLVWIVARKAYRVLLGFAAALAASCAIPLLFDAHVWQQYFSMMTSIRIMQVFIPTFGVALRFLIDRNAVGLQFIPAVFGCAWGFWYFRRHRDDWDWMQHGLVVVLVSDVCAPYGFFTDECILLPFILAGLYRATRLQRSVLVLAVLNVAALIEVFNDVNIISPWYLWTVPAWVTWYWYSTRRRTAASA